MSTPSRTHAIVNIASRLSPEARDREGLYGSLLRLPAVTLADLLEAFERVEGPVTPREKTILDEAAEITSVDRQKQYGPPEDSFAAIADLWSVYLEARGLAGGLVKGRDVAHMMILMKVARDAHGAKRDNLVDIAGYARCAEMLERKERAG